MDINKQLQKLFYDPKTGFTSENKFYITAKEKGLKISHKIIKDFLDKQYVNQIFKVDKRPDRFSSITTDKIRSEYQMDIIIYDRYAYHKYQYILCIIDIYSRYAQCRPMTNRENTTIMKNIIDIFDTIGKPKLISSDNEFNTIEFNKYCSKHDIGCNYSEPNEIQKNSIVERFNKTIAGYIKKLREGLKIYDWPKHLIDLVDNYNLSYHRTIRNKPYNIFYKKGTNRQDILIVLKDYKIGNKVRTRFKKKIFDKSEFIYYSKDVYVIQEIITDQLMRKKYLLSNGKIYSAKDIKKVSDIIIYEPEENNINADEEIEFIENRNARNTNKALKKVGIDLTNITEGKRIKKTINKLDL